MKLDLRQLRHVLALDRYRNFARAAEAIGLTQPALSRSLQALEDEVGARLFDRDRTRVEPTTVGTRLIELAGPLLTQAKIVERDLRQMVGLASGLLRIGAAPYPAELSVGPAVGRLVRSYPSIQIDLSVADWPELLKRVLADDLDLAIAEASHASDDERLIIEPLPSHRGVFYCRAGHPLADRHGLTLADLRGFPMAFTAVPKRLLELISGSDAPLSDELPEGAFVTAIRVGTPTLAKQIVMESDAVSAALPRQIEHEVTRGSLVVLPIEVPGLTTGYGVIRLARRTPSPAAAAFLAALRSVEDEIDVGQRADA